MEQIGGMLTLSVVPTVQVEQMLNALLGNIALELLPPVSMDN